MRLTDMDEQEMKDKLLVRPKPDDRFDMASGQLNDWPNNRGVFESAQTDFKVEVCVDNHLKIHCEEQSSKFKKVFERLSRAVNALG